MLKNFSNSFGETNEVEIMERKEIENLIKNLDFDKVISDTIMEHSATGITQCHLSLIDGSYEVSWSFTPHKHQNSYITIFEVPQNALSQDIPVYSLIEGTEYEKAFNALINEGMDEDEALDVIGVDEFELRQINLIQMYQNSNARDQVDVQSQLDNIYDE